MTSATCTRIASVLRSSPQNSHLDPLLADSTLFATMKTSAIFLVAVLAFAVFAASDAQAIAGAKQQTAAAAGETKKGAEAVGQGAVGVVKGAGNTVGATAKTGAEKVNHAFRPITAPIASAAKNVSGVVSHDTKAATSKVGHYTSNVGNAVAGKPSKP